MARLTLDQKIEKVEAKIQAAKAELKELKKLKKKEAEESKKAKAKSLAEKILLFDGLENMSEAEIIMKLKS